MISKVITRTTGLIVSQGGVLFLTGKLDTASHCAAQHIYSIIDPRIWVGDTAYFATRISFPVAGIADCDFGITFEDGNLNMIGSNSIANMLANLEAMGGKMGDFITQYIPDGTRSINITYLTDEYATAYYEIPVFDNVTLYVDEQPEQPAVDYKYAFNPIIVNISNRIGTKVRTDAGSNNERISLFHSLFNGSANIDLSGAARMLFDRDEFYNVETVDTTLKKDLYADVYIIDENNNETLINNYILPVIWGAKQIAGIGEKVYEELVYFPSYPFTIPVMRDADSKLRMRIDSGNYSNEMNISAGVKYNIPVNYPEASKSITVRIDNADDILNDQSIFTDEFDHTFRDIYDSTRITVLKVGCEPSGGIYLRWINTLGEWCYFLFRPQSDELKSESSDISFKEIYNTVNPSDPMNTGHTLYHAGTGQSIAKSGTRTMNIAAVFLNQDIFDYVSSITLSPIVDLYLGKNNDKDTWVRISVIDSDIIKSKEVLQNIQLEIQLPDALNQSL